AIMVILRKNNKDDYSEPEAYTMSMKCCLGKTFETSIARCISPWAETWQAIAQGHMGGRCQHGTNNAFVISTSWIKQKWREDKIVSSLFLDVKSSYS
ncbi:hypothetical protein CROQUDRAFT_13838, partial [Cronartium quercuum f. sp. fusiforme G11]